MHTPPTLEDLIINWHHGDKKGAQRAFAKALGVPEAYVSRWKNGEHPNSENLAKICAVLQRSDFIVDVSIEEAVINKSSRFDKTPKILNALSDPQKQQAAAVFGVPADELARTLSKKLTGKLSGVEIKNPVPGGICRGGEVLFSEGTAPSKEGPMRIVIQITDECKKFLQNADHVVVDTARAPDEKDMLLVLLPDGKYTFGRFNQKWFYPMTAKRLARDGVKVIAPIVEIRINQ